ncbi:hypothetical protein GJ744_012101 [Endocarpon pusillum]|uniref:Spindle pole body component n=1 Tax=Endocarpon pusillum TaxID=364733 RepID=A0A8H7AEY7_9EURO|nr:hypothetical protein GJ744_012101 [Endocarpon pusillum]
MLQEILLCLAGHPSPLLRQPQTLETPAKPNIEHHLPLLSSPERALLSTVAHLSDLHIKIKRHASLVSTSHRSTICKAVASTIISKQLQRFMNKIVEVERSILIKDAGYVGGYGIVPLSAVVGEFAPWSRRLEWLWEVLRFMQPSEEGKTKPSSDQCTGASMMRYLRAESHTGYSDLEEMALELVKVAEMVWLRQLSTWVLYGKLPTCASEDFFIQPQPGNQDIFNPSLAEFSIRRECVPDFVPPPTASSILFIGQSLHQIRTRDQTLSTQSLSADPAMKLLPAHLEYLKAIKLPISSSSFTNVIASIRLSMSQNALSQLLPLPKVLEILHVLQDFLLLGRGEFAISLISNADKLVNIGNYGQNALLPVREAGQLNELKMRDGELASVLNETWSELAALRTEGDLLDDTLERAREHLRVVNRDAKPSATDFSGLLFPSPTSLTLPLSPNSPIALFLTKDDIRLYSEMNSYLIAIRRAEIHLASLWKYSSLRRSHPCQIASTVSSTVYLKRRSAERRKREDERNMKMRKYWAVASKAQFVISELGGYFQGDIANGYWQHFLSWLISQRGDNDIASAEASGLGTSTLTEVKGSRPSTGRSSQQFNASQSSAASSAYRQSALNQQRIQNDPATLARAHQRYLRALHSSLLLNVTGFTEALFDALRLLDHFVALFARLQSAQQNLDLEVDEGVVDALANHRADEHEILQEMERSRGSIEEHLDALVRELRDSVDRGHGEGAWDGDVSNINRLDLSSSLYTPWRPQNIDGLLMKLEFIGAKAQSEATDTEDEDERYYSQ